MILPIAAAPLSPLYRSDLHCNKAIVNVTNRAAQGSNDNHCTVHALAARPSWHAKSAAWSAALSATRKEERKK